MIWIWNWLDLTLILSKENDKKKNVYLILVGLQVISKHFIKSVLD